MGKGEKALKSSAVGDLTSNTLSASELTERAAKLHHEVCTSLEISGP